MSPGGGGTGGVRPAGGAYRGRPLAVPPGARPTEARVREALFSIWHDALQGGGCNVLDLFAGSGVMAIEAAGRGALHVLAVDGDLRAVRLIAANAARVGAAALIACRRLALPDGLARLAAEGAGRFDLVFADPPYNFDGYPQLLAGLPPLLAEGGGEAVIEHSSRRELPVEAGGLVRTDERRYGESSLSFYRAAPV